MMEENKKKKPIVSIICIVIGLCLIAVGIIFPNVIMKKPKHVFEVEMSSFGDKYEFTIETDELIVTNTAYATIKVEGVESKKFKLTYNADESEDDEFVFNLWLTSEDASMFNEVVEVEIETMFGEDSIVFENEDKYENFGVNSKKILLTVFPCFFGVFFLMMGIVSIFAKKGIKHIKKVNNQIMSSLFGETEKTEKKVEEPQIQTITCKYCGLENDKNNAKCEHCGAPLIRRKKK